MCPVMAGICLSSLPPAPGTFEASFSVLGSSQKPTSLRAKLGCRGKRESVLARSRGKVNLMANMNTTTLWLCSALVGSAALPTSQGVSPQGRALLWLSKPQTPERHLQAPAALANRAETLPQESPLQPNLSPSV